MVAPATAVNVGAGPGKKFGKSGGSPTVKPADELEGKARTSAETKAAVTPVRSRIRFCSLPLSSAGSPPIRLNCSPG